MAKKKNVDAELTKLKADVKNVLLDCPDGVEVGSFWNSYQQKYHKLPDTKTFGVSKRSELLELCRDVYDKNGNGNSAVLHVKRQPLVPSSQPSSTSNKSATVEKVNKEDDISASCNRGTGSISKPPKKEKKAKEDISVNLAKSSCSVDKMNSGGGDGNFYDRFYGTHDTSSNTRQAFSNAEASAAMGRPLRGSYSSLLGAGPGGYHPGQNLMGMQHPQPHFPQGQIRQVFAMPSLEFVRNVGPLPGGPFARNRTPSQDSRSSQSSDGPRIASPAPVDRRPTSTATVMSANNPPTSQQHASRAPGGGRRMNYTQDQLNSAAEDCVERLSEAKDYVSREKIEKLLLQHFSVTSLQQLNLRELEQLSCVREHVRTECKVNAYIQNFVKVRSICTLYELHECLREFTPNKGDFDTLKLGPLVKLPLVYTFFKVPQDSEICELTTADVIEYVRLYLSKNNLWTSKMELEPFLKYMMEERQLNSPYELGLRITSPALVIQMLKKAQRDIGQTVRKTNTSLSQIVTDELTAAFRNFTQSVLYREGEMCHVRLEYLQMDPRELTIVLFSKLRQLLQKVSELQLSWEGDMALTLNKARQKNVSRVHNVLNNFTSCLGSDTLMQKVFQVAICCSHEQIHAEEFIRPAEHSITIDDESDAQPVDLPTIAQVIETIRKYLDRVVAHGPITLDKLAMIEARLNTDFDLPHFAVFKRGTFLEFLLNNAEFKKCLDESGGSLVGSSSQKATMESTYHATIDDLMEFVRQCASKEQNIVESAICQHYACKEVKSLGHGSVSALMKSVEKHQSHHQTREFTVYYESALVAKQLSLLHQEQRNTGVLGHVTRERALACLQNCPLLTDLAEWSHWDLIYKPQLKDLKDFIQKHGGVRQCTTTDGARKVIFKSDILAFEVRPGTLLRLTCDTSPEKFAAAAVAGDARLTAGHLVSVIATCHSLDAAPLVLLGNHVKTALMKMQTKETGFRDDCEEASTPLTIKFILECLTIVPLVIGHLVVKTVFLDALSFVVGQVRSKQLLIEHAHTIDQLNRLQALGILLGVQEWTDAFQSRTVFAPDCIEPIDIDMEQDDDDVVSVTDSENDVEADSDEELVLSSSSEDEDDDDDNEIVDMTERKTSSDEDVKVTAVVAGIDDKSCIGIVNDGNVKDSEDVIDVDDEAVVSDFEVEVLPDETRPTSDDVIDVDATESELSPQHQFVDRLRHEEFGVNVVLSDDGKRLMLKQQERLGRSLERLSTDLYSKDTHFVLELIQNADDNDYLARMLESASDVVPSLRFHITADCIVVFNNETGFEERNIRAVCDVGKTTKGKHKFGYIGQKGIGFKSVFRITDVPEIHSNGFHIRFDVRSGPLGYILPHWVEDGEIPSDLQPDKWTTCIRLPLKHEMKHRSASITMAARFRDIQPSLLLFLHRLRSITIYNEVESYESTMLRRDISDNLIEISHGAGRDQWLVVRKMLDASKISLQAKSGVEIESTELAIAFPLLPKKNNATQTLPPKQPVFAFLPLRSYGFRFIVQADFDVPSSREEVDRDSLWNQWLRSEIASVFASAIEVFKNHEEFSDVEAVCNFIQFVPLEDEILDFFRPVAMNILQQLRGKPCLPTQGLQWRLPSQLVVTTDLLIRDVVPSSLLRQHLDYDYLHRNVAAMLNSQLLCSLGVQTLNTQHLLEVGKTIVSRLQPDDSDDEFNEVEVVSISKWLLCVYKSMDEFGQNDDVLAHLRTVPFIPLSNGRVTSVSADVVFFPLSVHGEKPGSLAVLETDIRTVHPLLLGDGVGSSQISMLLEKLGVRHLTPHDIVNHHILPILKSQDWQSKSDAVLVNYLVYMMEQQSVVDMEELRPVAIVLTNHGRKRPADEPVHFSTAYLNAVDLQRRLPGFNWTLIDSCYLHNASSQFQIQKWHSFLSSLGVLDLLAVRKKNITLSRAELEDSLWSDFIPLFPAAIDEFTISDYVCEEFAALVNLNIHRDTLLDQMVFLFQLLDQDWDRNLKKFSVTQIYNLSGNNPREIPTSFGLLLKRIPWIPSMIATASGSQRGLARGEELFVKSEMSLRLLSDHVSYLLPDPLAPSTFSSYLGIQRDVSVDFVSSSLQSWCQRKSMNCPANFTTSLTHMKSVYHYLYDNMTKRQLDELMYHHPVIYHTTQLTFQKPVEGIFLMWTEVVWRDSSGLFDKYRESLMDVIPSTTSLYRYTLEPVYPGMDDFFTRVAHVKQEPDLAEFTQLLVHITSTCTVQKALLDVLYIFSIIGRQLSLGAAIPQDKLDGLKKESVIPGKDGRWLKIDCCPMIADDRKLEKLFPPDVGVCFVDLGEKLGIGNNKKKSLHKGVDLEHVVKFLTYLGVHRLTECLMVTPQTELYKPCPELQSYVRLVVPWIQRQLYTDFTDTYQFLIKDGIKARLAAMRFAQVAKLELVHSLTNLPDVPPVIFNETCRLIDNEELYVHKEHVTSYNDINSELARYFCCKNAHNCPDGVIQEADNCYKQIRSLLGDIQPLLHSSSQQLDELMERHQIETLPDTEELWQIREPVIVPVFKHYAVAPVAGDAGLSQHEMSMDTCDAESESGLKSWPPKSHSSGAPVPGVKAAPAIWPPPAPPDHVDRGQLPSNLRPSNLARPTVDHKDGERKNEGESMDTKEGPSAGHTDASVDGTDKKDKAQRSPGDHRQVSASGSHQGVKHEHTGGSRAEGSQITGKEPRNDKSQASSTEHRAERSADESKDVKHSPDDGTRSGAAADDDVNHAKSTSQPADAAKDTVIIEDDEETSSVQTENIVDDVSVDNSSDEPMVIEFSRPSNTADELLVRAGHKRARVNSGASLNDIIRPTCVKRPVTFYGPPVWLNNDDESFFEPLAMATSLTMPTDLNVSEGSSTRDIGDWGEMLVKNYLENAMLSPESGILEFSWANMNQESGLPYDFMVRYSDSSVVYIEVKSTLSDHKACFEFSSQQILFAHQTGAGYHLYRVYCAGNPERVRLVRIDNLSQRLVSKQLRLFMAI